MMRSDPSMVIVNDEQLALEAQEEHDRALEWAEMSSDERSAALRADPAAAREAREAARAEGLTD